MRERILAAAVVAALLAYAYAAPGLRRHFIQDVISWDAEPSEPVVLPQGVGPGLLPAARTRVILIDGLAADVAHTLPVWSGACNRGLALTVDVGFPTVSLPVQISLWTGLTQQQTGVVFRSDRPLVPPWTNTIPAKVPGSRAVAENHGYIVRSIGFGSALPDATPDVPSKDRDPELWAQQWETVAQAAVASDARLTFVHVLRVDTQGHRKGRNSEEYRSAAREADAILERLFAAAPDARWFLLSDHGHLATGGHGGEERDVRQIEHCIVGPGVAPGRGGPVHLVDVSRAIADSVGVTLDREAHGRPISVALQFPIDGADAVPPLALGTGVLAIFVLAIGIALGLWSVRSWWLAPWWFFLAALLLLALRGVPTLSTPMVFAGTGQAMRESWEPALILAAASTYIGLGRTSLARVLAAQLGLPLAMVAAAITACGAWPAMFGAEVAPVVPHYTAFVSPLLLVTAHGAGAFALAVLARTVRSAFYRRAPSETPQTASSSD